MDKDKVLDVSTDWATKKDAVLEIMLGLTSVEESTLVFEPVA